VSFVATNVYSLHPSGVAVVVVDVVDDVVLVVDVVGG